MDYPFRVQSAATSARRVAVIRAQGDTAAAEPQAGPDAAQQYLARILKLIPAEVVAFYQAAYGVVNSAALDGDTGARSFLGWLPWIGIGLVVFVRGWGTRDATGSLGSVQFGAVAIAVVSFCLWVLSLGNAFEWIGTIKPWASSLLLMVWTFLVPYFYKGS